MTRLSKKDKEIRQLKADALRRRLEDYPMTEPELAHRTIQNSRVTVAQWKSGKSWPKKAVEVLLEKAVGFPVGFFDAIAQGRSYDEAFDRPWQAPLETGDLGVFEAHA